MKRSKPSELIEAAPVQQPVPVATAKLEAYVVSFAYKNADGRRIGTPNWLAPFLTVEDCVSSDDARAKVHQLIDSLMVSVQPERNK